jgi:hypothetical protein
MEAFKIASTLSALKREAVAKTNDSKSLNYNTVIKTLESVGVKVQKEEHQEIYETGKSASGNPFSRSFKNGHKFAFVLNGKKFTGETTSKYFSLNLSVFISTINAIECAKSLRDAQA